MDKSVYNYPPYYVVIERDDGTDYTQSYYDFDELLSICLYLGAGYHIVHIY